MHNGECTAANVPDLTGMHEVLRGEEEVVFSDSGYAEVVKRVGMQDPDAAFLIAETSPVIRGMKRKREQREAMAVERLNAIMRAKVESPFRID